MTVATLIVLSLVLGGLELPYRFLPSVDVSIDTPVYVLGDSLSAASASGDKSWPE